MRIVNEKKRNWRHPSVRQLMLAERSDDPISIIRKRAREVVAFGKQHGWEGPPFNPELLASLRGISVRESTSLFSAEAQLPPVDGQLLLEFNPERSVARKNFSVCHEIAHTLFDDCYEMVHQRKSDARAFDPHKEVEDLCQIAAAEILMPEEEFLADLEEWPFDLSTLRLLTERYGASREAIGRRMITLGGNTAALLFLSRKLKPVEQRAIEDGNSPHQDFTEKMRILYAVPSHDFPYFIPPEKSAPDDSCAYLVNQADFIQSSIESWGIRDGGPWNVEALGLPMTDEPRDDTPSVLALVQPL